MGADLSRREFLERTARAAGLAGAAGIPASTLLAEAAEASHRGSPLPSPRNLEIDHFVVLMMENRSFDHYFGWLSDLADGLQQQSFPDPSGQQVPTRHFSTLGTGGTQYKGCGHPDPGPPAPTCGPPRPAGARTTRRRSRRAATSGRPSSTARSAAGCRPAIT